MLYSGRASARALAINIWYFDKLLIKRSQDITMIIFINRIMVHINRITTWSLRHISLTDKSSKFKFNLLLPLAINVSWNLFVHMHYGHSFFSLLPHHCFSFNGSVVCLFGLVYGIALPISHLDVLRSQLYDCKNVLNVEMFVFPSDSAVHSIQTRCFV